jgi:hypothetical protein
MTEKTETIPDETVGQRRLREARERAAERADNPSDDALRLPVPGELAHCLISGVTLYSGDLFAGGVVLTRGQTFVITDSMIQASRNVRGEWRGVALVHSPELQRYYHKGRVLYAAGPAPANFETWDTYGDTSWHEQRENARREAHALPTENARREALAAVHARFGPARTTSWSSNTAMTTSERDSLAEEAGRRAAALTGSPYLGNSSEGGGN